MTTSYFKIQRVISKGQNGMLLREYLLKVERISRRALKAIKFGDGALLVNSEPKTVRYSLTEGDKLEIIFPNETPSPSLIGEPMPLDLLFEDEHLLVVNKPANLPVIPSQRYPNGTLANGILSHFQKQGLSYTVHTVNRLDRDTSGLMLIAKHRHSHELFVRKQKEGALSRKYLALVHGKFKKREGTIDAPIARKPESIIERTVLPEGKDAVTHFHVVKQTDDVSLVKIKLETGRTHQIRVHFSYIGHPLLGDELYGGNLDKIKRQALHSHELAFVHPFTNVAYNFEAPCPEDIDTIICQLN